MRCPFCSHDETQVKDSRPSEDASAIRRRRVCPGCGARFTTFERVQLREMSVVKAGGRTQTFDREKVIRSMQLALRKRPVSVEQIEKAANSVVRQLESMGEQEVTTKQIGDLVMQALARLDTVGFVRYASVYKDFSRPEDFNAFVEEVKNLSFDTDAAEGKEAAE